MILDVAQRYILFSMNLFLFISFSPELFIFAGMLSLFGMWRLIGLRLKILLIIGLSVLPMMVMGEKDSSHPILIISSYNPETQQTSNNISEFLDEYTTKGGKFQVSIENMNCKSFSEVLAWKSRMKEILLKYTGINRPSLIVILGQEAWSSYLSLDSELTKDIPLVCGMVSRNAIFLPDSNVVDLSTWKPESIDVLADVDTSVQMSGFVYDYDVVGNIRLIRDFFPETKHIAFISDNSYGGVSLQAYVREEMQKFPELDLILLDGRENTVYLMNEKIENLPENTVILLGTWRVDMNDGYFMRNATYSMMMANPKIPAFSVTSIAIGHWAVGGCVPEYRTVGKDLAQQALAWERQKRDTTLKMQFIPNQYVFDYRKLQEYDFLNKSQVDHARLFNKKISFFEEYRYQIVGFAVTFIILLLGFLISLYFYIRTKRLKDALEDAQKDNILILNNVNAGIKFINPDFTVKWHNGVDFETPECNIQSSTGKVCYEVLRGLDEPCTYCPVVTAMKERRATEVIAKYPSNTYVYMYANPVFDAEQNLLGVVVRLEDVTKQKQVEMELRLAKEKAEESDRLKSAFLANMSHEIRTPLNAIVGFSEVLTADEYDAEVRKEYVSIIQKNSDLLLRLINDILDISRLETGRLKFSYEYCEVIGLCRSVMATTGHAKPPRVEYVFKSPVESFELMTDVQRLQQILINLMSNANKFTKEGSITLEIRIEAAEGRIYFSVSDTGCGIPEDKQKKVFERFEKLNEYAQGTGLGLAISKITITMMGGDIWVDKDYREGARFVFWHPLHIQPVNESE